MKAVTLAVWRHSPLAQTSAQDPYRNRSGDRSRAAEGRECKPQRIFHWAALEIVVSIKGGGVSPWHALRAQRLRAPDWRRRLGPSDAVLAFPGQRAGDGCKTD